MARILINAITSTAGGGITYIYNVLHQIAKIDKINHYFVFVYPKIISNLKIEASNIKLIAPSFPYKSFVHRIVWEQIILRRFIRKNKIDLLISLGNFALLFAGVKQVLFNRNALYFSRFYEQDLLRRKLYRKWLANQLKRKLAQLSILMADVNIVPTMSFINFIKQYGWVDKAKFINIPHGFDKNFFIRNLNSLPQVILEKLKLNEPYRRILLVSHYNYFRNFETLVKAIPYMKEKEKILLVLTTEIKEGAVYGSFDATSTSKLIDKLGVRSDIAMLGFVPYELLHQLYKLCDLVVFSSYAESFGHPMVEAMAMGLPVVVSDTEVHKEVCGNAAVYFNVFNERDLAQKCLNILTNSSLYQELQEKGLKRSEHFSWENHTKSLILLIDELLDKKHEVKKKKILINAVSVTAGGGVTYLLNMVNQIPKVDKENEYYIFVSSSMYSQLPRDEFPNINLLAFNLSKRSLIYRLFWSQIAVYNFIKQKKIDVLFSSGNFGLFFSPVKQILFSRNPIYFSKDYERDLLRRKHYSQWLINKLKKIWSILSILCANVNLAPTRAFANCIKKHWEARKVNFITLSHGFNKDYFCRDKSPLDKEILEKLKLNKNYKRIFLVAHYNYFRNFETLIKAIPYLKKLVQEEIMITLTTKIDEGLKYGDFDSTYASRLIDKLGVRSDIAMLGFIPYHRLHHLYKLCDVFVFPSYTESFGHPMVEAMAMGLPVVAADTDVHREVCGEAALYFKVFSEEDLAQKIAQILNDKNFYQRLREKGFERSQEFSWENHIKKLLDIMQNLQP